MSRKSFRSYRLGGLVEFHGRYYRKDSLPSPLLVAMVMVKGVPMLVGLVLGLHHGDSYILGS
jgi:hypothetical protein